MRNFPVSRAASPIPARAGIGWRAAHYQELIETQPDIGWIEVHSENYFGAGGAPLHYLEQARALYPLSLHGVGLSLGSADPLNRDHLTKLKTLIDRFEPGLVSDHLSWSSIGGTYLNDLLPLPYTQESLRHFVTRVSEAQDFLKREILIENPSSYLTFQHSTIPEAQFLAEVAARSGCGILLDVNNIYVSASNHGTSDGIEPRAAVQGSTSCGFDAQQYLRALPTDRIGEIHLAGFSVNHSAEGDILIDSHSPRVADAVWDLYRLTIGYVGARPTLIEWDTDVPALAVLREEADKADRIRESVHAAAA